MKRTSSDLVPYGGNNSNIGKLYNLDGTQNDQTETNETSETNVTKTARPILNNHTPGGPKLVTFEATTLQPNTDQPLPLLPLEVVITILFYYTKYGYFQGYRVEPLSKTIEQELKKFNHAYMIYNIQNINKNRLGFGAVHSCLWNIPVHFLAERNDLTFFATFAKIVAPRIKHFSLKGIETLLPRLDIYNIGIRDKFRNYEQTCIVKKDDEKKFELHAIFAELEKLPSTKCMKRDFFDAFLLTFKHLKSIDLFYSYIPSSPPNNIFSALGDTDMDYLMSIITTLLDNNPDIEELAIGNFTYTDLPLDKDTICRCIEKFSNSLKNLKNLKILKIGQSFLDCSGQIFNLENLNSLEELFVDMFGCVQLSDFEDVSKHYKKLKKLYLNFCENDFDVCRFIKALSNFPLLEEIEIEIGDIINFDQEELSKLPFTPPPSLKKLRIITWDEEEETIIKEMQTTFSKFLPKTKIRVERWIEPWSWSDLSKWD